MFWAWLSKLARKSNAMVRPFVHSNWELGGQDSCRSLREPGEKRSWFCVTRRPGVAGHGTGFALSFRTRREGFTLRSLSRRPHAREKGKQRHSSNSVRKQNKERGVRFVKASVTTFSLPADSRSENMRTSMPSLFSPTHSLPPQPTLDCHIFLSTSWHEKKTTTIRKNLRPRDTLKIFLSSHQRARDSCFLPSFRRRKAEALDGLSGCEHTLCFLMNSIQILFVFFMSDLAAEKLEFQLVWNFSLQVWIGICDPFVRPGHTSAMRQRVAWLFCAPQKQTGMMRYGTWCVHQIRF